MPDIPPSLLLCHRENIGHSLEWRGDVPVDEMLENFQDRFSKMDLGLIKVVQKRMLGTERSCMSALFFEVDLDSI